MLEWAFPRRCVLCQVPGAGMCAACIGRLVAPVAGAPGGVDGFVAVCEYSGAGRDLVLALKRRNRRDAVPLLGHALAEGIAALLRTGEVPTLTWPPTTGTRRRARGFDQAEALARGVARAGGWPVADRLRRVGGAQHGGSRSQRWSELAFDCTGVVRGTMVVVDDVVASGATMAAASAALRQGGAARVLGAAVAASTLGGSAPTTGRP